jgi:hypothetical protein
MVFKRCTESPLAYHWHASESADLSLRQITHTGLGQGSFKLGPSGSSQKLSTFID